jgi:hypothetical protein
MPPPPPPRPRFLVPILPRVQFEHVNFMEVIAGADTTSGVPMIGKKATGSLPKNTKLVRTMRGGQRGRAGGGPRQGRVSQFSPFHV